MEAPIVYPTGQERTLPAVRVTEVVYPASWFLCLFAAAMPLMFAAPLFEPYISAKQYLLVAGAAALFLLWAICARDIPVTPLWKPLAGLALLGGISLVRVHRFDVAIAFASAAAVFWVALSEMREASRREPLALLIVATGTLEAVYVLWQGIAGDPLFPTDGLPGKWRAFGTFGNPNWTGEFLAAAILVAGGMLTAKFSRAIAACAVLMTAALAVTFARGAWLALALGALAFALCRKGKLPAPLRMTAEIAGVCGIAAAAALAVSPQVRFYLLNLKSIQGRIWMWLVSLRLIADAPLGVGIGNFGLRFPEAQARMYQEGWSARFLSNASFTPQAHNDYLQFIAEAGVLAAPCLAVLLWMVARRGKSLGDDGIALGLWAAAVSLLIGGLYASPLYLPGSMAMTAILLGASESAAARSRAIGNVLRGCAIAAGVLALALAGMWVRDRVDAEVRLQRAAAMLGARDWKHAIFQLEAARRRDPGWVEVYSMLGRAMLAQREFKAAAKVYQQGLPLAPDTEVMLGGATALWHAGRKAEAIKEMQKLVWLRPDLPEYRAQLDKLEAEK